MVKSPADDELEEKAMQEEGREEVRGDSLTIKLSLQIRNFLFVQELVFFPSAS